MKKKDIRILLVDDDADILEIVGYNLSQEGYQISTAVNGKEAIAKAKKVLPHLIIMDVMMPEMDGWEFVEAYGNLKIGQKGKIIIVMLTTSLNPDDKKKADHYKAISDFEFKPLTLKKLEEIIKKHF